MEKSQPLPYESEDYSAHVCGRAYWDDLSAEWGYCPIEKKLVILAGFVNLGGDLNKVLERYAEDRSEDYRSRIQHCIMHYLTHLIEGEPLEYSAPSRPIVNRIKRLEKEELVRLLSEELRRRVVQTCDIDRNGQSSTIWKVSTELIHNDEVLDNIEREHWKNNPEESFSSYLNNTQRWGPFGKSMW